MDTNIPSLLVCPKCGTDASCNCGVAPIDRAKYELLKNPQKSDRAIAAEIGVHKNTVNRARKAVGPQGPTEKRTGKDGKKYKPTKPSKPPAEPGWIVGFQGEWVAQHGTPLPAGWRPDQLAHKAHGTKRRGARREQLEAEHGKPIEQRASPEQNAALVAALDRILARERAAAGHADEDLAKIRESLKESSREKFDRLLEKARAIEIARLRSMFDAELKAAVDKALAKERAELREEQDKAQAWARDAREQSEAARVASAGIDTHMTQAEFDLVKRCLHPDMKDNRTDKQLNQAFAIFNRLEKTVNLAVGVAELRKRGWGKVRPFN